MNKFEILNNLHKIEKVMKLYFQRKIRKFAQWLEYQTSLWVVPRSTGLCCLIENTDKPNFVEFNRILDELEQRWKIYDSEIQRYKVLGRLAEFKQEHKNLRKK